MSHNIKHKLRNRIFEGAAIATIMIPMASPIIAHATDTPTPVKVSTTGTKVKIDDAALQKAIADAKAAGVDLTQEKTDTQTVKSSEVASAKSKITDGYKTQVSTLEAATKKQTTANTDYATKEAQYQKDLAQYNKDEAAYEAAIAKHTDDTPIADKNGIKVYGDYNEAGKGSLDYYKNFDVVVDGSKVKDIASVSDLGWNKDSKVTAVGTTKVVNSTSDNFNAPSKDMYLIKNFDKGQQLKIENVGTDKITGKKINAVVTFTNSVKSTSSDDHYLAVGKQDMDGQTNDSIRFEYLNVDGVKTKISYEYSDGKPANLVTAFAIGDIDFLQGQQTDFGNVTQLNPKDNGLNIDENAPKGLTGTYTPSAGGYDGFNSTPLGTVGLVGTGSSFTYNFMDNYTTTSKSDDTTSSNVISAQGGLVNAWTNGGTQFNLFGSSAALNVVTPPVKPTPPTKETVKASYKFSDLYTTPEPHKSETDDSGKDNNGQNVKPGQTLKYKLTWDLKGLEAIDVDKDTLAKGLSFMDDYDETKLDITEQTKKDFTVIDAKTQKSVMDELQQDWDIKNGKWTLKAKNVQDFLTNHAGHELTITFNPVVKKDATGTVTNTAVQNDFGQDFDTETVKNPITPDTPKPDTPATPNTSYGEAPKGWLCGAVAAIALVGAAFGFRKPIKKWFHK
ncbi:SspB-related isopeptide-forming adhesin [Leuconostoc pseudomesenteroides]|uniref:SspB-related isopeptide-forming adhesin n=1 Tax=Leuconostoc pseudomesenteroides TaxID=33968 RepID=UPI00345E0C23